MRDVVHYIHTESCENRQFGSKVEKGKDTHKEWSHKHIFSPFTEEMWANVIGRYEGECVNEQEAADVAIEPMHQHKGAADLLFAFGVVCVFANRWLQGVI